MISQVSFNFLLYLVGAVGILINKKNVLTVLMCVELMLLSVNLNFIFYSIYLDDFLGSFFSLFILTVAASESSIGLAILILYNRLRNKILINEIVLIKY